MGALLADPARSTTQRARVALLEEPGFPSIDGITLTGQPLASALSAFETTALTVQELERLNASAFDVFINPYGSAFPKQGWPNLIAYLRAGGNWLNLGGVPFAVPVVRAADGWRSEARQTAFHKTLGITQAFPVDTGVAGQIDIYPEVAPFFAEAGDLVAPVVYELYYRLTREPEFPGEDGSDGVREATVTPLVSHSTGREHPIAVPIVRVDRLHGPHAGGRWVLANFQGAIATAILPALIEHAALGASQLDVRPSFACYRRGEIPVLTVTLSRPGLGAAAPTICQLGIFDDANRPFATADIALHGAGSAASGSIALEPEPGAVLPPGLYRAEATLDSVDSPERTVTATTAFWVFDRDLLRGGKPFTTDAHSLLREGKPYIVTGTSYMASDVHRRFLLEPNPHVWDRDFAAMRRAGINMIRTGIWTGWKRYMPQVGNFEESALRALDAFLLTARRHDIPVIFTFFAFIPESWGGANPYLDAEAVQAQKTFVASIVSRYREMNDVIWDLINEPSFCSPDRLWVTRPNYDDHEAREWRAWLQERYPSASTEDLEQRLAELWRALPEEALDLPRLEEFGDRNIFEGLRPLKAADYRLFANEMFSRWARDLADFIRREGSAGQLVTVGQDEGGTYERPAPMFHGAAVDFTSNHTWWLNDDLLWDSIVTKTPGRPNLISETGVMFYERIDGSAWRTEATARDLLERKLVIALATDTAGFIEWIWNTNPYMPLDNEAAIGLLRADGSAKPELAVVSHLARFTHESLKGLGPRQPEPALMVIPHSNMFSVRNQATAATQRCVRAMHYHCQVPMRAVSEYALDRIDEQPQLIVVPSPRVLSERAWRSLLECTRNGATLLISGPFDDDDHWLPASRMQSLGLQANAQPVAQEETLKIGDASWHLSFRGEKLQRIERSVVSGQEAATVIELPLGEGRLIWSPLPVELAEQVEPTVALYRRALASASLLSPLTDETAGPGVLIYPAHFRDATLYALVSELGHAFTAAFSDRATGTRLEVALPAGRAALLLLDRGNGSLRAVYQPA
ncbi:MAG: cellulase family glycosylhydrolase [Gemmatimonadota bacterium]|nr:MAG: cellulase family glycosylhydrolase [Gemmatimonadota bacterium]